VTTVISVRGLDRDILLADMDFVYVGRAVFRPQHWKASVWGNPFKVGMKRSVAVVILADDIDNSVRAPHLDAALACLFYRAWILKSPAHIERLPELRGKRLGCWCCNWSPGEPKIACHAVILAKLADAKEAGR
jgi:hypothetical protein